MTTLAWPVAPRSTATGFGPAVLRHAIRMVWRGAAVVAVVAAGMSALVVQQHRSLFANPDQARSLEVLAGSPAIRIMFGEPVALDDPGGFTVWRTGTPLAVLLAVWALLVTIRITRGEEEAGRWDLLLAGRWRLGRMVVAHLAVIAGAGLLSGAAVAVAMVAAAADPRGSILYGAALAAIAIGVAGWGGLAAQLVGDRRRASVLAAAGIGAALLARMVADGVEPLRWLHWCTPFGLLGLLEPFSAQRVLPLAVLVGTALVGIAAAWLTSARRDAGAGVLPTRQDYRPHLALLRSLPRFALRRGVGSVLGWGTGIWLYFVVIGLLSSSLTAFLADNPLFADLAAQAGFGSLTTVTGYLASLFALLAIPLGLYAASRIAGERADEEARRLTMVFAAPVTRTRWLVVQIAASCAGTVVLAGGAGLAAWVGSAVVGADVTLAAALAGALNVLPVAWLSLGAAVLAFGWVPSATLAVGALPVAGGFLLQVLAESLAWPDWVAWLSPFAHLEPVPYASPDWVGAAGMTLIAAALCLGGLVGFIGRDLQG